ncbi:MAG: hypothetical protein K0V04_04100 [Deltaproteobacteria bacterium]|nr:hypothetical protein [Deltaproteobacteria bacterium]
MRRRTTENTTSTTAIRTICEDELAGVRGGTSECTPYDLDGDGVTTDEELDNGAMYEYNNQ